MQQILETDWEASGWVVIVVVRFGGALSGFKLRPCCNGIHVREPQWSTARDDHAPRSSDRMREGKRLFLANGFNQP